MKIDHFIQEVFSTGMAFYSLFLFDRRIRRKKICVFILIYQFRVQIKLSFEFRTKEWQYAHRNTCHICLQIEILWYLKHSYSLFAIHIWQNKINWLDFKLSFQILLDGYSFTYNGIWQESWNIDCTIRFSECMNKSY